MKTVSRSTLSWVTLSIGAAWTILTHQNCSNDFRRSPAGEESSVSPFETKFVALDSDDELQLSQNEHNPVFSQQNAENLTSNADSSFVNLGVVIDLRCVRRECDRPETKGELVCSSRLIGNDVRNKIVQSELDSFAAEWTIATSEDQELLQKIKTTDYRPICIRGITSNKKITLTADPLDSRQWHHRVLKTSETYTDFTAAKASVKIAVIDTGFSPSNAPAGIAIKSYDGTSYGSTQATAENPGDCNGHGSLIANLIADKWNDGIGGKGVAPEIEIASVRSYKTCDLTTSATDSYNAIQYALAKVKPDVLSLSFGTPSVGSGTLILDALVSAIDKGVVVVTAAGNDHLDIGVTPLYPAAFASDYRGLISVGATNEKNEVSPFSNYSELLVEIAAPGEALAVPAPLFFTGQTKLLKLYNCEGSPRSYTCVISGTSFSTPIAAAFAARAISYLKSKEITYSSATIEEILNKAGTDAESTLKGKIKSRRILDFSSLQKQLQFLENSNKNSGQPTFSLANVTRRTDGRFDFAISYKNLSIENDYIVGFWIEGTGFSDNLNLWRNIPAGTTEGILHAILDAQLDPTKKWVLRLYDSKKNLLSESNVSTSTQSQTIGKTIGQIQNFTRADRNANNGTDTNNDAITDYILRGWACVESLDAPLEVELWLGSNFSQTPSERTPVKVFADKKSRGNFSEKCKSNSVLHGFELPITRAQLKLFQKKQAFIKVLSPDTAHPENDSWAENSGALTFPELPESSDVSWGLVSTTRSATGVDITGWTCSKSVPFLPLHVQLINSSEDGAQLEGYLFQKGQQQRLGLSLQPPRSQSMTDTWTESHVFGGVETNSKYGDHQKTFVPESLHKPSQPLTLDAIHLGNVFGGPSVQHMQPNWNDKNFIWTSSTANRNPTDLGLESTNAAVTAATKSCSRQNVFFKVSLKTSDLQQKEISYLYQKITYNAATQTCQEDPSFQTSVLLSSDYIQRLRFGIKILSPYPSRSLDTILMTK